MRFPTKTELLAGVGAYNAFLADVWRKRKTAFEKRIASAFEAAAMREGKLRQLHDLEVCIKAPPKLAFEESEWAPNQARARLLFPGEGHWRVAFRARMRRERPLFGNWRRVKASIERLRVEIGLDYVQRTPVSARYVGTDIRASIDGLKTGAVNWLAAGFYPALKRMLEGIALDLAGQILTEPAAHPPVVKALHLLAKTPPRIDGEGPSLDDLEPQALAMSARVQDSHMPWRIALNRTAAGEGASGEKPSYCGFLNAARWTGFYVAAEAYRYAATGDVGASDNARRALWGLETLLNVSGVKGRLARGVVSIKSPHADDLRVEAAAAGMSSSLFEGSWRGVRYLALDGATRDQYAGALFGAGLAGVLIDQAKTRNLARRLACAMADFLLAQGFCPTGLAGDDPLEPALARTAYFFYPNQVVAALQVLKTFKPDQYADDFERFYPVWSTLWFFNWLSTLDPHGQYADFAWEHAMSLLALKLETDPARRDCLAHGLLALRLPLKRHANPLFNLIELEALTDAPESFSRKRADLERETLRLIGQAFSRPESGPLKPPAGVKTFDYRGLSAGLDRSPEQIAAMPLPVEQRPAADFLWSRSPFALSPEGPAATGADIQSPPIDRILPYWIARYRQGRA